MEITSYISAKGLRPTKIRRAIGALLFDGHDKHVTVDDVIYLAREAGVRTSVASVYNTLNHFAAAGLLRRITVEQGRAFFDTNLSDHYHVYFEKEERLEDIPAGTLNITGMPNLPEDRAIKAIDVIVRV